MQTLETVMSIAPLEISQEGWEIDIVRCEYGELEHGRLQLVTL